MSRHLVFDEAWEEFLGACTLADAGPTLMELKACSTPPAQADAVLRAVEVATSRAFTRAGVTNDDELPRVFVFWANGTGSWKLTWDTPKGAVSIGASRYDVKDLWKAVAWDVTP